MGNNNRFCNECKMCCHEKKWNAFVKWILKYQNTLIYALVLGILTTYVICNWEICVSMQFFNDFDGNNILFLVWILLIFLILYNIEGSWIKFRRTTLHDELNDAQLQHDIDVRKYNLNATAHPIIQNPEVEGIKNGSEN